MNKDKLLNSLVALFLILGLSCIGFVLYKNYRRGQKAVGLNKLDCVKETYIVDKLGEWMKGALPRGRTLTVYTHYYDCNPVSRGDMVFFNIAEGLEPVVRFVRGVPGDSFAVQEMAGKKGEWSISINGQTLNIDDGSAFFIQSAKAPALRAAQLKSDKLGPDQYILLSKIPPGNADSSTVGLVSKSAFIGRAVVK